MGSLFPSPTLLTQERVWRTISGTQIEYLPWKKMLTSQILSILAITLAHFIERATVNVMVKPSDLPSGPT